LLICVYCLSFAPALLYLPIPGADQSSNARLLFFFVTMALFSEAMQFIWNRLYGRHVIAASINEARTWEGLIGGAVSAALVGMVLHWATPFANVWQTALMSMIIAIMGFAGAMTMSAIKRDRGVRDYGTLVEGHGGELDRIDAICFAAPVFYHVSRVILQDWLPTERCSTTPCVVNARSRNARRIRSATNIALEPAFARRSLGRYGVDRLRASRQRYWSRGTGPRRCCRGNWRGGPDWRYIRALATKSSRRGRCARSPWVVSIRG